MNLVAALPARLLLLLLSCAASHALAADDPRRRPATSWDVRLAPAGEPGEPFEMTGVVRDRVRGRPMPRAKVYVYHADAKGAYARSNDPPRLAGTLLTDEQGRYRIRSVFPGSYGGYAAHVHFEILEPAHGQGFLNVRQAGRHAPQPEMSHVAKLRKDNVWQLEIDLQPGAMNTLKPGEPLPRVVRPARDADAWTAPRRDTSRTPGPR